MGKVLHASGSGYFPFCIQESTDSKDAIWSLEKAMQTYWRVKSWNFTGGGVVRAFFDEEDGGNIDTPFSDSFPNIPSIDGDGNPNTEESNLVCSNGFFRETSGIFDVEAEIGFDQPKKVGDLYDSGINGYIIGLEGYGFLFSSSRDPTSQPTPYGGALPSNGFLSILGANVPMYADFNFRDDDADVPEETISSYGTLTPASWWSYGGTYNTSTGAKF